MFIIVLGGGIDLKGNLPPHVYQRLNKALQIYHKNPVAKIVTTGKYSFLYRKITPPTTEAEKMAEYLYQKGTHKGSVLLEKHSKDSLGNAYHLKTDIFIPHKESKAIIITSHFHLERIRYIFDKIFGPDYQFEFVGVQEKLSPEESSSAKATEDKEKKVVQRQKELLEKTKAILATMKTGDHDFLKGKLYKIKYYREKRPAWVINFVAKGK